MESASLKLTEQLDVPVVPDRMWSLITEPASVVSCMPGASLTGVNDDGSLSGTLVTKFGPTTVRFQGKVALEFDHQGHIGRLEARGGDQRGRTKAAAVVAFRLLPAEAAGTTQVSIDAVIDVSGGLAPFVRTGGLHLTRRMLQEFAANLSTLADSDQTPAEDGAARPEAQAGLVVPPPPRTGASAGQPAPQPGRPVSKTVPPKPISGFSLLTRTILDIIRGAAGRLLRRDGQASS